MVRLLKKSLFLSGITSGDKETLRESSQDWSYSGLHAFHVLRAESLPEPYAISNLCVQFFVFLAWKIRKRDHLNECKPIEKHFKAVKLLAVQHFEKKN